MSYYEEIDRRNASIRGRQQVSTFQTNKEFEYQTASIRVSLKKGFLERSFARQLRRQMAETYSIQPKPEVVLV